MDRCDRIVEQEEKKATKEERRKIKELENCDNKAERKETGIGEVQAYR